ncbi:MAG TPA: hypothetical protein VFR10_13390 [bacterium]|nr:hypothetical protein [bacterium]
MAAAIAVVLIWLSGDPLALRPADVAPGGSAWWGGDAFLRVPRIRLLSPPPTVDSFPREFRWDPIEGALEYEITVGADDRNRAPLFRQRGPGNSLEVSLVEGVESLPAGNYVWEVRALNGSKILARGLGRFQLH